jgi:hypothetical protein
MHVLVATHGHCFDGLCSAVMFTRLLQGIAQAQGTTWDPSGLKYVACGYGIGQRSATPELLVGDQNALLDYRFTASSRLDWYFDHHRTAFANETDRAYFESRRDGGRYFFDASYGSCTKLVSDIGRTNFAVHDPSLDTLVGWAERIDSASFASAEQACDFSSPIMRFVSVVEHHGNDAFITRLVPELLRRPLLEVAASSDIERRYQPLGERFARFRSEVESHARDHGRVVLVDLTERATDVLGKFVTYALFPSSVYSVVAARQKHGFRIAVGYNPWCGQPLDLDVSAICSRYGGGGHRAVGGISFPDERAAEVAPAVQAIVEELNLPRTPDAPTA